MKIAKRMLKEQLAIINHEEQKHKNKKTIRSNALA